MIRLRRNPWEGKTTMTVKRIPAKKVKPGMTVKLATPRGDSPLDDWTKVGSVVPESDGSLFSFYDPQGTAIHECGYIRNADQSITPLPYPWRAATDFLVRPAGDC